MSQFENVETSALLDVLAEYTRQFIEPFTKRDRGKQYDDCKDNIKELQAEIQQRKKTEEGKRTSKNN
jgi:hypothetical protein